MTRTFAIAILALAASTARPVSAGPIGIGVEAGHPTGLSLETSLADRLAFQAGLGTGVVRGWGLHAHAEVLWIVAKLADDGKKSVPLYLGGGFRLWDHHYDPPSRYDDGTDTHLGLLVPIGVAIQMKDQPFDFFVQAAVVIDVAHGGGCSRLAPSPSLCRDESRFDVMFGIGGRYYFGRSR